MKTIATRMSNLPSIVPRFWAIAFLAIAVSPSAKAATITAFGQEISIPKSTVAGTVVARHYITPQQACGQSKCTVRGFSAYPNGDVSSSTSTIITTNVSGISTRLLINGTPYGMSSPSVAFTQPIEVQLVGDGRENKGGSLAGGLGASLNPSYFFISTSESPSPLWVNLKAIITPIDGTCSVPDRTIKLTTLMLNHLDRVGATAGTQSFQFNIDNCPKGYNRVGYTLEPVGGVIANSPGVLPPGVGSTASGIGIRVEDTQGKPASMMTSIRLTEYSKTAGGSFVIPMQASYIRTSADITPGVVNGAMNVFLDYR